MQKYKFLILAIALSILPINTSTAQTSSNNSPDLKSAIAPQLAQHQPHREKYGGEERNHRMLQQLNLTNNQDRQIEAIEQKFENKDKTLRQQVQNSRQKMRLLLARDASDAEIRQQYQVTKLLLQKLSSDRFELRLQIMKILTPRQKSQLAELIEEERT